MKLFIFTMNLKNMYILFITITAPSNVKNSNFTKNQYFQKISIGHLPLMK